MKFKKIVQIKFMHDMKFVHRQSFRTDKTPTRLLNNAHMTLGMSGSGTDMEPKTRYGTHHGTGTGTKISQFSPGTRTVGTSAKIFGTIINCLIK